MIGPRLAPFAWRFVMVGAQLQIDARHREHRIDLIIAHAPRRYLSGCYFLAHRRFPLFSPASLPPGIRQTWPGCQAARRQSENVGFRKLVRFGKAFALFNTPVAA